MCRLFSLFFFFFRCAEELEKRPAGEYIQQMLDCVHKVLSLSLSLRACVRVRVHVCV